MATKSKPPASRRPAGGATRKKPVDLHAELAAAGLAEVDDALAAALRDISLLEAQIAKLNRVRSLETARASLTIADAQCLLVAQSVRKAARRRGLELFGIAGEEAKFSPADHALTVPAKTSPARVRIKRPGVRRATPAGAIVLIKAEAATVRAARKTARPA